jgi:UDP-2,3-diacylglucosamine hydrolase
MIFNCINSVYYQKAYQPSIKTLPVAFAWPILNFRMRGAAIVFLLEVRALKIPPGINATVARDARVLFFSDAHLGSAESPESEQRQERVIAFLEHARTQADVLVILGDLFDFYFEYKTVLPACHFRVLAALESVSRAGVSCYYTAGNHDFWLGPLFSRTLGVTVVPDTLILSREGRPNGSVLAAHGDGIGPGDRGYKLLKRGLRNSLLIWLFRQIHPDWGRAIAGLTSRTSRKYTLRFQQARVDAQAETAKKLLAAIPELEAVVLGHTHIPVNSQLPDGQYLNAGDWCTHFTYVSWTAKGLELKSFNC